MSSNQDSQANAATIDAVGEPLSNKDRKALAKIRRKENAGKSRGYSRWPRDFC